MKKDKVSLVDSRMRDNLIKYLYGKSPPLEKIDEIERLIRDALSRDEDPDVLVETLSKLVQNEKELLLAGALLFYHYKVAPKRPKIYKTSNQKQMFEEKIRDFHIREVEEVRNPMFSPTYQVKVNEEPLTTRDFAVIAVKAYYKYFQNSPVSILGVKRICKRTFLVSTNFGEIRVDSYRPYSGYLYTPEKDVIKFIVSL